MQKSFSQYLVKSLSIRSLTFRLINGSSVITALIFDLCRSSNAIQSSQNQIDQQGFNLGHFQGLDPPDISNSIQNHTLPS